MITKENVSEILKSFIGKQEQIPPIYSAIKVNGKKLYEYARIGQEIEIKPRKIEIYDIKLINIDIENSEIEFEVFCGKGTYIRSLCEDMANKMETVGFMKELKRIQVGEFKIEESITISELEKKCKDESFLKEKIMSIEEMFKEKPGITLKTRKLELFLNGVKLTQDKKDGIYKIYNEESQFIGIGVIKDKLLKREIYFL